MIGSISKIRPCGHHHYYKYSHCKSGLDLDKVSNKSKGFFDDIDENGTFYYPLPNLKTIQNNFGDRWSKLKWFKPDLSTITNNFSHLFSHSNNLEKLNLILNAKSYTAVPGIQMQSYKKRNFELKFLNASYIGSAFQQCSFADGTNLKVWAPIMTNASNMFEAYGGGSFQSTNGINVEIDCSTVVTANRFAINHKQLINPSFPIDEDGVHTFGSGKPEVGRKWMTFPSLSQGKDLFTAAPHGKEYTLAFLNDLPNWSNDTTEHLLSFSCHIDHKYDPEVNLALKKCDHTYLTPIEELGASLPDSITEGKGWTLTMYWTGTATANAYPAPTV